jgi:hypothetical protein
MYFWWRLRQNQTYKIQLYFDCLLSNKDIHFVLLFLFFFSYLLFLLSSLSIFFYFYFLLFLFSSLSPLFSFALHFNLLLILSFWFVLNNKISPEFTQNFYSTWITFDVWFHTFIIVIECILFLSMFEFLFVFLFEFLFVFLFVFMFVLLVKLLIVLLIAFLVWILVKHWKLIHVRHRELW